MARTVETESELSKRLSNLIELDERRSSQR
jgi:hypothetical protein